MPAAPSCTLRRSGRLQPFSLYPTVGSHSRHSSSSSFSVRFDNRTYEFPARPLPPRSLPPSPPLIPLDAIADVLPPPLEPVPSFPSAYLPPPAVQFPPFCNLSQGPPAPSFVPPPLPLDKPQDPSIDEFSCNDLLKFLEFLIPTAAAEDLAVLSSPRFLSFVGLPVYSPLPSAVSSCPSSLPSTPHAATFPARMDERLKSAHLAVSPEGRAELILVDAPVQNPPATAVTATSCVK
ncbi:hypothetical protein JCM10213_007870 [Rhodosporidiobolus nylandii]